MHILVSVIAYGVLTLAAVAGAAVALQERALKTKRPTAFTRQLPAVAEGEALQERPADRQRDRARRSRWRPARRCPGARPARFLRLDHKTVLSLATFVVIVVLLWLHHGQGLSGRRAARYVLVAYLLLTLAYPGVKFVTDVVIG